MLRLENFRAWVSMEGVQLETHGVEMSLDRRTITCWIASQEGKRFSVSVNNLSTATNAGIVVYADGLRGNNWLCGPKKVSSVPGLLLSNDNARPFLFANLELTDDDSGALASTAWDDIGIIKIEVFRLFNTEVSAKSLSPDAYIPREIAIPEEMKLHERCKKAGTHRVQFGEAVPIIRPRVTGVDSIDQGMPYITFIFKYRPLEILKANGIVTSSMSRKRGATAASPVPEVKAEPHVEGNMSEGADSSNHAALEKIKLLEANLNKLRAQVANPRKRQKVKEEPRIFTAVFTQGEVIDLT